jgi:hypothetical protein
MNTARIRRRALLAAGVFNNHPPRLPADIFASADRNLVVRDGMASFFYHPYLGTD